MQLSADKGNDPGQAHGEVRVRGATLQGVLNRIAAPLEALASSRNFWLLALGAAFAIGPSMFPYKWSDNEIVYFDLAYRSVQPDAFTDAHAMFDASNSRIVAMMMIGTFIKVLGFELAKTALSLLAWALYALGLAAMAKGLGMRVAEMVLALLAFIFAGQALFGGEWIFGTVEPKVLAYTLVFFSIAAALTGRGFLMILLAAGATYFHFLVGGAWAILFLLLLAMNGTRWRQLFGLLALYTLFVLPILLILVQERSQPVDTSALGATVDQVYALYRVPHHVAPFAGGLKGFVADWLPGLTMHVALAFILLVLAIGAEKRDRALLHWGAILNSLLLLATLAALFDSQTHHLAKFLIFRPSALTLLISSLLLAKWLAQEATGDNRRFGLAVLVIAAALQVPVFLMQTARTINRLSYDTRLEWQMTRDERNVTEWIRQNTPKDASVLVEPPQGDLMSEGGAFPLGLERLTGRGLIVLFKNVPADTADFVRWYVLLQAKAALFAGDCSQLARLKAEFVVFRSSDSLERLRECMIPAYSNDSFTIARTKTPS